MKKTLKMLLAIMMVVVLLAVPMLALADDGSPPADATDTVDIASAEEAAVSAATPEAQILLVQYALQVAATLLITLIGILGAYLSVKLGKNANLKNINDAQKELIRMAKITIGELKQTTVDAYKAGATDGKLTPTQITELQNLLIKQTIEKLSAPAYALLAAASVDIEALISGVGESWIGKIKSGGEDPTADPV